MLFSNYDADNIKPLGLNYNLLLSILHKALTNKYSINTMGSSRTPLRVTPIKSVLLCDLGNTEFYK